MASAAVDSGRAPAPPAQRRSSRQPPPAATGAAAPSGQPPTSPSFSVPLSVPVTHCTASSPCRHCRARGFGRSRGVWRGLHLGHIGRLCGGKHNLTAAGSGAAADGSVSSFSCSLSWLLCKSRIPPVLPLYCGFQVTESEILSSCRGHPASPLRSLFVRSLL